MNCKCCCSNCSEKNVWSTHFDMILICYYLKVCSKEFKLTLAMTLIFDFFIIDFRSNSYRFKNSYGYNI